MYGLLDCNPAMRTSDEWRALLGGLVESLGAYVGRPFRPMSWFVHDDRPGFASSCNCVDVRANISDRLGLEVCGVVCITVNFGEVAWASCDLLLFAAGRRVRGPEGMDLISFGYDHAGWAGGWTVDANGEWEAQADADRWQPA